MKYIRILTRTEGKTSAFEAPAEIIAAAGIREICFFDGEDRIKLTAKEKSISLERRGSRGQRATFLPQEVTAFSLSFGEREGTFPLFTSLYRIRITNDDIAIRLGYELRFGDGFQRFLLRISVFERSEDS